MSCVLVSIVRYGLKLKSPKKATLADFIPTKVIRFTLNVIDSHLCNIKIKDLEKNEYLEEPKTAFLRPIFQKNEKNKQDKKV